ncbi:MAG: copper resistance protein B [Limnobacter sp.]|uniref:copper resistance protein B n=1 Tax=Limnobacter sp. TaxID=2003368 RepID=UPI003002DA5B
MNRNVRSYKSTWSFQWIRSLGVLGVVAVGAVSMPAMAMEDESIYSYTLIEVDSGKVRNQPGSIQLLGAEGWIGGDYNRFAWRFDGERRQGKTEVVETQALYSRYIAPFWDLQGGIRHDSKPVGEDYAVIGLRGLAPYAFDVDLQMFVRSDGKVLARTRFENDFLMTNRFILRPFINGEWSASNLSDEVASGLYQADFGVQARYEFSRKFAPYIEVSRTLYPETQSGSNLSPITEYRVGLRLIF